MFGNWVNIENCSIKYMCIIWCNFTWLYNFTVKGKRKYTQLQFYVFIYQGLSNSCGVLTNFFKQTIKLRGQQQQQEEQQISICSADLSYAAMKKHKYLKTVPVILSGLVGWNNESFLPFPANFSLWSSVLLPNLKFRKSPICRQCSHFWHAP